MTFFGFRHAKKNSFALLIRFATGELAINSCGLDFSTPVALHYFDCLSSILSRFGFHRPHSVSIAAVIGGNVFALSCWIVIMSATEPMINAAASNVRTLPLHGRTRRRAKRRRSD